MFNIIPTIINTEKCGKINRLNALTLAITMVVIFGTFLILLLFDMTSIVLSDYFLIGCGLMGVSTPIIVKYLLKRFGSLKK